MTFPYSQQKLKQINTSKFYISKNTHAIQIHFPFNHTVKPVFLVLNCSVEEEAVVINQIIFLI